jgi:transcriptional regulator with XRE-family HTH domain
MGKGKRPRPVHLGNKLRSVREQLGLSQNEMLRHLGLDDELTREELSAYERSVREPPLHVLLKYSQVSRVWMNVLADDELELPVTLPSPEMHAGLRKRSRKRR